MDQPGFSIIVTAYNSGSYIKKTLEALLALDYPDYEIIIINDASTDGTEEYLNSLTDANIRVIHNERNLKTCEARNRGVALAKNSLIAFTDHDCLPKKNWLEQLAMIFSSEEVGFTFGQVIYVREGYRGYFPERLVHNDHGRWPMGCNLAFRKSTFTKLSGFDPVYFPYGNEDTELALRAITQGVTYARAPGAIVYHQAMDWTVQHLWRSARNASVWPRLKRLYPRNYLCFEPRIKGGVIIEWKEYVYMFLFPLLLPLLLIRYFLYGKRNMKIFFAKWPIFLLLKRWYIWHEAVRQRIFML